MATQNENSNVPTQSKLAPEVKPIKGISASRGVKHGNGWSEQDVKRDDIALNDNILINASDDSDLERKVTLLKSVLAERGLSIAPKPEPANATALWAKHQFLPVTMVTGKRKDGSLYKFFKAWVCSLDSVKSVGGGF